LKILVTGHLGYIGNVLAPLLHKAGHEVVGLDTDLYRQCTFGQEPETFPELRKDLWEGPRYMRIDHIRSLLATGRLDATLRWQAPREAVAPHR
jgi:nucleoside-diphosphate-sugar epimerase